MSVDPTQTKIVVREQELRFPFKDISVGSFFNTENAKHQLCQKVTFEKRCHRLIIETGEVVETQDDVLCTIVHSVVLLIE